MRPIALSALLLFPSFYVDHPGPVRKLNLTSKQQYRNKYEYIKTLKRSWSAVAFLCLAA